MDFSSKQALGVVVVIAIAALVIVSAVALTKTNDTNAEKQTNSLWDKTTVEADA